MASSSAECSWDKPPFNFVRGRESTMWDIVCFSPQGHKSVAAWFHNFLQTPQWPCAVRKRLSRDHCCRRRRKPGCQIVWSSTRVATRADLQFSFHWLLMTKDTRSCHRGFLDGRQECGGLVMSEWTGQSSCAIIFSTSLSVATFLRKLLMHCSTAVTKLY